MCITYLKISNNNSKIYWEPKYIYFCVCDLLHKQHRFSPNAFVCCAFFFASPLSALCNVINDIMRYSSQLIYLSQSLLLTLSQCSLGISDFNLFSSPYTVPTFKQPSMFLHNKSTWKQFLLHKHCLALWV